MEGLYLVDNTLVATGDTIPPETTDMPLKKRFNIVLRCANAQFFAYGNA